HALSPNTPAYSPVKLIQKDGVLSSLKGLHAINLSSVILALSHSNSSTSSRMSTDTCRSSTVIVSNQPTSLYYHISIHFSTVILNFSFKSSNTADSLTTCSILP